MAIYITEDDIKAARLLGATARDVLAVAAKRMFEREYPGVIFEDIDIPEDASIVAKVQMVLDVADLIDD